MRRFIQNFELFWLFKFRVGDWLQSFLMRFSVLEDLNTTNNHQIQNLKFSIFEIGFIRKPHCSLTEFWPNFETSKNKKVNFDPSNFSKKYFFLISCLNKIIKGYKSQSPAKFTSIYYLYQVPPLGGMSKNDEKSLIFDDFRWFWQNSRLPGAGYPRRDAKNGGRLSFDDFIPITFTKKNPGKIRNVFDGSKSLYFFEKSEFWTKSVRFEASLTKEIQWWQIENFKIVNFESHDRFFLQKWSLMM